MAATDRNIRTEVIDDVIIYSLEGNIIDGGGTAGLQVRIQEALKNGNKFFVLNLTDVDFVNSTGLGGFLGLHSLIKRQHGYLFLVQLSVHVHEILKITQAVTIFPVFETVAEAMVDIQRIRTEGGAKQSS